MFGGLTRFLLGCLVASLSVGLAGAGPVDAPRSGARAAAGGTVPLPVLERGVGGVIEAAVLVGPERVVMAQGRHLVELAPDGDLALAPVARSELLPTRASALVALSERVQLVLTEQNELLVVSREAGSRISIESRLDLGGEAARRQELLLAAGGDLVLAIDAAGLKVVGLHDLRRPALLAELALTAPDGTLMQPRSAAIDGARALVVASQPDPRAPGRYAFVTLFELALERPEPPRVVARRDLGRWLHPSFPWLALHGSLAYLQLDDELLVLDPSDAGRPAAPSPAPGLIRAAWIAGDELWVIDTADRLRQIALDAQGPSTELARWQLGDRSDVHELEIRGAGILQRSYWSGVRLGRVEPKRLVELGSHRDLELIPLLARGRRVLATRKGDWAAQRLDLGTDPPAVEVLADGLVAFDAARAGGWIYATDMYGLWTLPEAALDGGPLGLVRLPVPGGLVDLVASGERAHAVGAEARNTLHSFEIRPGREPRRLSSQQELPGAQILALERWPGALASLVELEGERWLQLYDTRPSGAPRPAARLRQEPQASALAHSRGQLIVAGSELRVYDASDVQAPRERGRRPLPEDLLATDLVAARGLLVVKGAFEVRVVQQRADRSPAEWPLGPPLLRSSGGVEGPGAALSETHLYLDWGREGVLAFRLPSVLYLPALRR